MDHQAEAMFEPVASSVAQARSFLASFLAPWCLDELTSVAVLLVSELAANAVVHARSRFGVRLTLTAADLVVEVQDQSPRLPKLTRRATDGGRGITIVDALAADWGHRRDGRGKVVWFSLQRSEVAEGISDAE